MEITNPGGVEPTWLLSNSEILRRTILAIEIPNRDTGRN